MILQIFGSPENQDELDELSYLARLKKSKILPFTQKNKSKSPKNLIHITKIQKKKKERPPPKSKKNDKQQTNKKMVVFILNSPWHAPSKSPHGLAHQADPPDRLH